VWANGPRFFLGRTLNDHKPVNVDLFFMALPDQKPGSGKIA